MERTGPTMWQLGIGRDISAAKAPLRSKVLESHPAPQPGSPVPGRGIPITSGCENRWGLYPMESQAVPLRGPHTDSLTHRLTCSGSSACVAARRALETYGEELNELDSQQGLERQREGSCL